MGFGSLRLELPKNDEADTEITAVYVHPSAARQDVGTAVYTELEARARGRDARSLGLTASLDAVPFYEAHEYERVGEVSHEFSAREATGVAGTVVDMRKRL